MASVDKVYISDISSAEKEISRIFSWKSSDHGENIYCLAYPGIRNSAHSNFSIEQTIIRAMTCPHSEYCYHILNNLISPPAANVFLNTVFMNSFASLAASGTLYPFASSAVKAAENVQPVP